MYVTSSFFLFTLLCTDEEKDIERERVVYVIKGVLDSRAKF